MPSVTQKNQPYKEPLLRPLYELPRAASKVPEITAYFWIVKILTTAIGESTSDYLVFHMNPVIAVVLGFFGFVVALVLQLALEVGRMLGGWLKSVR